MPSGGTGVVLVAIVGQTGSDHSNCSHKGPYLMLKHCLVPLFVTTIDAPSVQFASVLFPSVTLGLNFKIEGLGVILINVNNTLCIPC